MNCPKCNNNLLVANTQGVEIDYCPNCKGVWLDRGELDKIIERSNNSRFSGENEHSDNYHNHHEEYSDSHNDNHSKKYSDYHNVYGNNQRNKKGFLADLFDF